MSLATFEELFEHELEDVYFAEHELLEVLDNLAEGTEAEAISTAFRDHRKETEGHVDRLESVFEIIGEPPEEEECEGIEGLVAEHEGFLEREPEQPVLDLYNLTSGQKTEHYEIAAYENLVLLAERQGMDEASRLLRENLDEERAALERLMQLAEEYDYEELTA